MELDDLKQAWHESRQNDPALTPLAEKVFSPGYRSGLKRIAWAEYCGIGICLAGAVYILVHFDMLNTLFLKGTGILAILVLMIVSLTSFVSVRQLTLPADMEASYSSTLQKFANRKIQFNRLQKFNFTLSHLLLVTVVILIWRFFTGKDISGNKYFWTSSFTLGYLFLVFYSKWVAGYYKKTLQEATDLLKETAAA